MLVIRKQNCWSDYIFEEISKTANPSVEVITYKGNKNSGFGRLMQKIRRFLIVKGFGVAHGNLYQPGFVQEVIECSSNHNTVLLFDIQNLKDIIILSRLLPRHRLVVFLWNPAKCFCRNRFSKRNYINSTRKAGIEVCTFDRNDAKDYGFYHVEQPYRLPTIQTPDYVQYKDVFFVGQEKKRSPQILHVKKLLQEAGLRFTCFIIRDKHCKEIEGLEENYTDNEIEYGETLRMICQHKAYLEILQEGQSGMTLRPLEALFMRRKLISDNQFLLHSHLYHPSRILILTKSTTCQEIKSFLEEPFVPLSDSDIMKHEINNWLEKIKEL